MAWQNKCSSVHICKTYEARHQSISWYYVLSFPSSQLIFMHLNFPHFFSTCNCLFPPQSPRSLSFLLALVSVMPPGLLDQRAFLWDHLERPVEVEEEKERMEQDTERGGEGRSERVVESLGEVGIVERKFFCQGRLPLSLTYSSFHSLKHFETQAHTHTLKPPRLPCCFEDHCIWSQGFRSSY